MKACYLQCFFFYSNRCFSGFLFSPCRLKSSVVFLESPKLDFSNFCRMSFVPLEFSLVYVSCGSFSCCFLSLRRIFSKFCIIFFFLLCKICFYLFCSSFFHCFSFSFICRFSCFFKIFLRFSVQKNQRFLVHFFIPIDVNYPFTLPVLMLSFPSSSNCNVSILLVLQPSLLFSLFLFSFSRLLPLSIRIVFSSIQIF